MTKVFDQTMNLPFGNGTPSKISKYSEGLNQILTSDHKIAAFIGGEFMKLKNIAPIEVRVGSQSYRVFDASEHIEAASHDADKYKHESEMHAAFLKRFTNLMLQEFPILMAYSAFYLGVDLSDTLDSDYAVIEDAFNLPVTHQVSLSANYIIGSHEVDTVFHLLRIISFLRYPFTGLRHRGIVVICHSIGLLPVFYSLSRIVEEAVSPPNLFTFLPVLTEVPNFSFTANLSIILKSADIDSAVRFCVTSLLSSCGTKSWKPYIILVEEAIKPRVLNRMKHILTTNVHSKTSCHSMSGVCGQLDKIERYLKNIVLPDGGELITLNDKVNRPFFITNMELSVLARFPFEELPISHLFSFRTVKEAVALANHCFNLTTSRCDPVLYSRKRVNMCANLWTSSFTTAWYLAASLVKSGLSNVFVNASHQQVMNKMYSLSQEPTRVDAYSAMEVEANSLNYMSLDQASMVKLFSPALKAQYSWNDVASRDRRKLLHLATDTLGNEAKSIFEKMRQLFETVVEKAVGNSDNSELMPFCSGCLLQAHEWLLPTGPIIVLIPDTEAAPLLLHVCLYALLAGNAIIIIYWKDTVCNKIADIHSLHSAIPNKDLVSFYNCTTSCTLSDVLGILAETYHPGLVIPLSLLRASHDNDNSDGLMTNSEIFQPWISFFKRSTKLFWSIGDNTFID